MQVDGEFGIVELSVRLGYQAIGSRPTRSTLRWNRIPARPPISAPIRLMTAIATARMTPPVVRVPSLTGILGKPFIRAIRSYRLPAMTLENVGYKFNRWLDVIYMQVML